MAEPVTLEQAKAHLRKTDTSEDGLIPGWIAAAREYVERETGHILVERTLEQAFDRFSPYLELFYRPVDSDSISIAYSDANGAPQTLDDFAVTTGRYPFRIYPDEWPSTENHSSITVSFTAGYAPGEEPQELVQALLIKMEMLADRGKSDPAVTKARQDALDSLCQHSRAPGIG